jgi:hypothetical protein
MAKELHGKLNILKAIHPKAVGTTGAANGSLSDVIDRRGYHSLEYILNYGVTPSAVDKFGVIVYESDSATAASFTSVADADLIGTEADAGTTSGARASGTTMNLTKKIGYRGNKRYSRIRVYGIGSATGIVAANAVLGHADLRPVA